MVYHDSTPSWLAGNAPNWILINGDHFTIQMSYRLHGSLTSIVASGFQVTIAICAYKIQSEFRDITNEIVKLQHTHKNGSQHNGATHQGPMSPIGKIMKMSYSPKSLYEAKVIRKSVQIHASSVAIVVLGAWPAAVRYVIQIDRQFALTYSDSKFTQ